MPADPSPARPVRLRPARPEELDRVVDGIRRMVEALEELGNDAMCRAPETWAGVRRRVDGALAAADHLFLCAESAGDLVGLLEARVERTGGVFLPQELLHVSAIHVHPARRREGIARRLLEAALAWGRERGCRTARLHVLAANPARALYAEFGFREFRLELRAPL